MEKQKVDFTCWIMTKSIIQVLNIENDESLVFFFLNLSRSDITPSKNEREY